MRNVIERHVGDCPTCGRPFRGAWDFPRVEVLDVRRLPTPEVVDDGMIAPKLSRRLGGSPYGTRPSGRNLTPHIDDALGRPEVATYLDGLKTLAGKSVMPDRLLPPWDADRTFRRAYPVGESGLYLALREADDSTRADGRAEVELLCDGLNLGSAGGPTLSPLGPVVALHYRGVLPAAP